jgi:hypothetical protein
LPFELIKSKAVPDRTGKLYLFLGGKFSVFILIDSNVEFILILLLQVSVGFNSQRKMTSAIDKNCTFLISSEKSTGLQQEDICKDLESSDINIKTRYDVGCI